MQPEEVEKRSVKASNGKKNEKGQVKSGLLKGVFK